MGCYLLQILRLPVVTTILGVIVGSFLGYFISRSLARRQRFDSVAEKFRNSFNNEIIALKYSNEEVADILSKSFTKHETAYRELKLIFGKCKRKKFEKAWKNYNPSDPYPGNHEVPLMSQHFSGQSPEITPEEIRSRAIKQIEELLEFAK